MLSPLNNVFPVSQPADPQQVLYLCISLTFASCFAAHVISASDLVGKNRFGLSRYHLPNLTSPRHLWWCVWNNQETKCEFWQLPRDAVCKSVRCQAHKSESDDVVKRSEGQNSTREKRSCGVSVSHPSTCSDRTTRQAGRWREAGRSPSRQRVKLQCSLKGGLRSGALTGGSFSKENLKHCPLSQRRWQAQKKSHEQIPSAHLIASHQGLAFWCQCQQTKWTRHSLTVQTGEVQLSGLWEVCFQFTHLKKKK